MGCLLPTLLKALGEGRMDSVTILAKVLLQRCGHVWCGCSELLVVCCAVPKVAVIVPYGLVVRYVCKILVV